MIIEIPNRNDFDKSGLSMLNLAWDSIANLYHNLHNANIDELDDIEITEEFWQAAQRPVSIALALAQQGIELLLKGKIAEISPFLLIVGSPREWPSGCTENDTPFANFRTIDSHELIRAHDAIIKEKLSQSFKNEFEKLRRLRNVIFHGADNKFKPTAINVFKVILEAIENLKGPKKWIEIRRDYFENTPESVVYSTDYVEEAIIFEIECVIRLLGYAEAKRLLGYNKKQRAYICYQCALKIEFSDVKPKLSQLSPNTPDSTQLYCLICNKHHKVTRKACENRNCKGNVLDAEDGVCLTCYDYPEYSERSDILPKSV